MVQQPFQAIATTGRQLTETLNTTVKQLGDTATATLNQLLQAPAAGLRGLRLPGIGGQAGAPNLLDPLGLLSGGGPFGGGSSHRGNPNGFNGLLGPLGPGDALAPVRNLVQAFSQIEDVAIPRGLPRPSQIILGTITPEAPAAVDEVAAPIPGEQAVLGVEGAQRPAAQRRAGRMLGVQAV